VSKPDIQYFTEDGTWVKPPGAKRVTVVLKGGNSTLGEPVPGSSGNGGGAFFGYGAGQSAAAPAPAYGGRDGELDGGRGPSGRRMGGPASPFDSGYTARF